MKKFVQFMAVLLLFSLLTGCMYPQEKKLQLDQLQTHVQKVQSAVELYEKEKKVLPYQYKDDEIKFTSKSIVDFKALGGYVDQIPPSAFEQGGYFIYVLTDVEKKPIVRLFDLRVNNQIEKAQILVNDYKQKNKQLPIKAKLTNQIYTIDLPKLGLDEEEVRVESPYDPQTNLTMVMDADGKVMFDYRTEAMKMIQILKQKPSPDEDLRNWMARQSLYVPAFAVPMKYQGSEPVFYTPKE